MCIFGNTAQRVIQMKPKTPKEIKQMYDAWKVCGTVSGTAKACGVHQETVKRYKRLGNWETIEENKQKGIQKAIETKAADLATKTLQMHLEITGLIKRAFIARYRREDGTIDYDAVEILPRDVIAAMKHDAEILGLSADRLDMKQRNITIVINPQIINDQRRDQIINNPGDLGIQTV